MAPLHMDRRTSVDGAYRQRLVIFFLVIFAFATVTIRTEIQQESIASQQQELTVTNHRIAQSLFRECQTRNYNTEALNKVLATIIAALQETSDLTAADRKTRITLYTNAKGSLVDCGSAP